MTRRVGILGGTFDPPHIGHLAAAVCCRDALGLDEVRLTVANDPWQKSGHRVVTAAEHRLAMVRLAVEGLDGLEAWDVEMRRGGPSYTVETIEDLPDSAIQPILIVGADAASGLDTWHRADELAELVEVAVVARSSDAAVPAGWKSTLVDMPRIDVNSSELRSRPVLGRSLDVFVPAAVVTYIQRHDLYSR